ncbi:hypothetical protein PISMIDRAFT_682885 [Pisolithus microcarpus 441]|uniref:Unplaced genomic scaffold scaffold_183, whole genome shotgun sequence n=1 Tax=Pisolithus microcarpus 441 TaxID=765257 RepID=A0A0C9Y4T4_9AGAM|nr:hypothetical protein PISMIDRAFT_686674 [Pisolithus microcarpus 441]KIK19710.1 hypothetical protein PISMIDRAFT_682885 [Pisolithus microcarpus 441]
MEGNTSAAKTLSHPRLQRMKFISNPGLALDRGQVRQSASVYMVPLHLSSCAGNMTISQLTLHSCSQTSSLS